MNNVNADPPESNDLELMESAWRRPLTTDEEARLRLRLTAHPQARAQWEGEAALTRALRSLPDAPVSSNFTALVMQAVQRAPARPAWWRWFALATWFPQGWPARLATGAAMLCLSLLTMREYQVAQRQKVGENLAAVSRFAALTPAVWVQDYDTIANLNRAEVADDDLIHIFQ